MSQMAETSPRLDSVTLSLRNIVYARDFSMWTQWDTESRCYNDTASSIRPYPVICPQIRISAICPIGLDAKAFACIPAIIERSFEDWRYKQIFRNSTQAPDPEIDEANRRSILDRTKMRGDKGD